MVYSYTIQRCSTMALPFYLACLTFWLTLSLSHASATSTGEAAPHASPTCSPFNATEVLELILAEDYKRMDGPVVLPRSVEALKERGAHRCWHKHSTFLQHLTGVHNILRLWGQGPTIGRVGLFHSAYSNSYVNLALFDPTTERPYMQDLVGSKAESLVHLFCIIDRQEVVVNTLLRQAYIPAEGLTVPHLRLPDEQVFLNAETLRLLVVFTMADIADQYFGWQDLLFGGGGAQGSMLIPGEDQEERHETTSLWPGVSQPGLWMSYLSQLGQVVRTYQRSESDQSDDADPEGPLLDIPPVFANCTETLSVQHETRARDLYWSVTTGSDDDETAIATLETCINHNPWAFEPYVLLAQKRIHRQDFVGALAAAEKALQLQTQWGTAWDKRLSMGAWIAWTRVLLQRANDQEPWPRNSWDVNNLGLVRS
jgi:hypothetical protein